MKRTLILVFSVLFLVSCNDNGEKKNKRILAESSGNINQLTLVVDNTLWEGEVGEAIRDKFASIVDGLPQEEPMFSLNQIPPESFEGFARRNRAFILIENNAEKDIKKVENVYARPQTGIIISGQNEEELATTVSEVSEDLIDLFKTTEMTEQQRRMGKSLGKTQRLKDKFGLSLKFPSAYRYAAEEDKFVWLRKDIKKGNMEILIYEVPISQVEKDSNIIGNIIKIRDSIGEAHIPGPKEGTHMITEEAYAPYLFETEIDGKFTYETRGTWEVKGAYMAGPFLNYAIKDEKNNRYLILEGFVFKPSRGKRNHIFELDAIFDSAKIR